MQEQNVTPELNSEQPPTDETLTMLAHSEHRVTEGATLPEGVGGLDSERRRAGRPRLTDEERRERKRERDRARYNKKDGPKAAPKKPPEDTATASAQNAALIVMALDTLALGVSGGEYIPPKESRALCQSAWAEFLESEGLVLPPWVQVAAVSAAHVAPAFATAKGKEKALGVWGKVKALWTLWRGGK